MINKIYDFVKKFIKENLISLIVLIVVALLFFFELPYSIYTPGGAVNLNDRVEVLDGYQTKGSFNMAYVSMVKGSIPFLLLAKIIPDWDIVKKEEITADDESMKEMMERERIYLEQSIDTAIINAYRNANEDIDIKSYINKVAYIADYARTDLKVGDEIREVNGKKIASLSDLSEIVSDLKENEEVVFKIIRNDKEKEVKAKTYKTEAGIKVGISLITLYDYEVDKDVNIKSKASEAGSSGGLMMSLTVYNQLVEEDITKGKKIVGTGTIDIEGNVGEIGGVKYKLIGAVKKDADVFIVPSENYEEAMKVKKEKGYDIKIIEAKTFQEVLEKLKTI